MASDALGADGDEQRHQVLVVLILCDEPGELEEEEPGEGTRVDRQHMIRKPTEQPGMRHVRS